VTGVVTGVVACIVTGVLTRIDAPIRRVRTTIPRVAARVDACRVAPAIGTGLAGVVAARVFSAVVLPRGAIRPRVALACVGVSYATTVPEVPVDAGVAQDE
jgi:hypothetical protein